MSIRTLLVVLHDLCAAALAWVVAYLLRFNFELPAGYGHTLALSLLMVVPLQAAIFWVFGLYRGIWRFASLPDLKRIINAVGVAALAGPLLLFMAWRLDAVPRSVLVLDPLLLVLMMGGSRFLYRSWKDGHLLSARELSGEAAIVLGSGEAAAALLRELARSRQWHVVGLLDDNPNKHGRQLQGVPILGPLALLKHPEKLMGAAHAIIAMPSASTAQRRHAAELAAKAGLNVLTVPAFADLLSGRVAISSIRRVELEDLLGRDAVQLDDAGLHGLLAGKTVLVTGAGGSIGSELCRQIAAFGPARLVFYELSEFALYRIEQEFADSRRGLETVCVVGDVKDAALLDRTFARYRPDVVFHAAAYKHVPMMEGDNAWQALRNNVLGTLSVARAAAAHGCAEFVMVSTDKAVNPTNVMGASKRLAERACQALQAAGGPRFVTVRFGNVLGSSGSVIPRFREQIAKGGPVTVTHPEIVRYFMLIPEAAQLVLQAGLMASTAAEGGQIFVLDMGEPVKIADLARDMIRLSGFSEDDIRVEFTGLRPGEKLYEELLADSETTLPTPHPKLRIARAEAAPDTAWLQALDAWLAPPLRDSAEVKAALAQWVPEYQPARH
jgi:FlaA1/EpsC-like NDP-sugar epimerase